MPSLAELPAVPGVTHRDVRAGGVGLHLAEAGNGRPVVLLHGWPQHWWSWRKMIPALARTRHVLAPDLRGWGWSDAPPGDYAKATFAADVIALLDAEGIDRADLIGHDWGGYVAFLLALEHPERFGRLVALDITPPWRERPQARHIAAPLFMSYQVLLATPRVGPAAMTSSSAFVRRLIRMASGRGAGWTDAELDAYADVLREPARAQASSACYRTFLTRELPELARRGDRSDELRVPALLIMGGASALHRVLHPRPSANVRVEVIPGAGHFLPEERPDEVLALAEPFLSG